MWEQDQPDGGCLSQLGALEWEQDHYMSFQQQLLAKAHYFIGSKKLLSVFQEVYAKIGTNQLTGIEVTWGYV